MSKRKIRVGLLVNEYFGELGTCRGGYGFLAKNIVAKLFPVYANVEVEVLLGRRGSMSCESKLSFFKKISPFPKKYVIDGVSVFFVSRNRFFARKFLSRYDVFLSIECSGLDFLKMRPEIPLVFWIQDPRPWYDWREISTAQSCPEKLNWDTAAYELVHSRFSESDKCHQKGGGVFVSQAKFLNEKARDLYRLPNDERIEFVPNPLEVEFASKEIIENKENVVVFLGRLDDVKRAWLFCEVAKRMPELEFYVCGSTSREDSLRMMNPYFGGDIKNLHFLGHVVGKEKSEILKKAKILVNTSIHEALPVSFIEALALGVLIVSCQNPDNLTEKFGYYTGKVLGDGFKAIASFENGIRELISNESKRIAVAQEAVAYVKTVHNPKSVFQRLETIMRKLLK